MYAHTHAHTHTLAQEEMQNFDLKAKRKLNFTQKKAWMLLLTLHKLELRVFLKLILLSDSFYKKWERTSFRSSCPNVILLCVLSWFPIFFHRFLKHSFNVFKKTVAEMIKNFGKKITVCMYWNSRQSHLRMFCIVFNQLKSFCL